MNEIVIEEDEEEAGAAEVCEDLIQRGDVEVGQQHHEGQAADRQRRYLADKEDDGRQEHADGGHARFRQPLKGRDKSKKRDEHHGHDEADDAFGGDFGGAAGFQLVALQN